jgi:Skp family chaperone for outer membrane proteins
MTKSRLSIALLALLAAAVVAAQQPVPAPAKAFDSDACMKHCKEMAEAHQKMMDSQKAMKEKHDAAWKEIQAQLESAKKARGEKKVAALESVVEKLVAFHGEMQRSMGERMPGMMGGRGPGMGHEMGGMMGHGMMGTCPCCQGGMAPPAGK